MDVPDRAAFLDFVWAVKDLLNAVEDQGLDLQPGVSQAARSVRRYLSRFLDDRPSPFRTAKESPPEI